MRADFKVVLDACVLANFGVCDFMLRLAETPRLYSPRWSDKILDETNRTQLENLRWPKEIANSFQSQLRSHFPESLVSGYDHLIDRCENDPKDKHVLACAIHCQAEVIVTFNLRDFKPEALEPWRVIAQHPQDYLLALYSIEPLILLHKLENIARRRNRTLEDQLIELGNFLPAFSQQILEDLNETR